VLSFGCNYLVIATQVVLKVPLEHDLSSFISYYNCTNRQWCTSLLAQLVGYYNV